MREIEATRVAGLDVSNLAAVLRAAARAGTPLTYAEVLNALGFAFSRPKIRALCVALDDVDAGERVALAGLVVRASDGVPGQGWWVGRRDYRGDFTGPAAAAYVAARQAEAFAWWSADGAVGQAPPERVQGSALPAGGPASPPGAKATARR